MVKRKVAAAEIENSAGLQTKKKKVSVSSSDDKGKLDTSLPVTLIESLLGDTKLDDFLKTYWEKKPLVVKRSDSAFYGTLVSLETIKEVIQNNELDFQSDVNVCRYVNSEKELLNEEGQIKPEDIDRLMNEKQATFQFQHPQRYVDELWNIIEKLETYFGSLVGSSVYITAPNSQGLAPHCDDVEMFVLQLEGSQQWKLYKPMVELSRDYTQDLLQESIGEPTLDVTLNAGDLLYFPRGVIYQNKSESSGHSTHISIATYQQNTWGDFMNHAVTQAIENALEDDVSIRSGLPINYLSMLGTGKNMSSYIEDEADEKDKKKHSNLNDEKVKEFKNTVQNHLAKLVDHIDVNTAADAMSADFMASRLPPYGHVAKEEIEDEAMPTINDQIKIKYPEHVRIVYDDEEENEDDEDDDDSEDEEIEEDEEKPAQSKEQNSSKNLMPKSPKKANKKAVKNSDCDDDDEDDEDADVADIEPHIKVIHSLDNDRFSHMSGGSLLDEEIGCIKLHVSFGKAAIELLNSDTFVAVKDLLMEDDEDKITLATILFANDLIEMKCS